jgi:aryl-alcohol dehydrogenase-like predicted oxidoreductase
MRTRSLGAEGPEVSVVGLGTNNFGARIDYDESQAVLDEAIEQGITLVDTADIYSQGTSEEFIGRALEGRRDAVFLATKFGKEMNDNPSDSRGSPEYIRWAVEGSRFVAAQNEYSLVRREAEDELLPLCDRLGIGVLPYFPLASGLLTGKHAIRQVPTEGRLAGREIPAERWEIVEKLQRYAQQLQLTLLDIAIGGLLAMPAVTSVIAGATKPEQVRANVRAGSWEPKQNDVAVLRALR